MSMNRRGLLKTSAAVAASLLLPSPKPVIAALPRRKTLPIIQGPSDQNHAQFSVVHPSDVDLKAFAGLSGGGKVRPDGLRVFRMKGQATSVTQFFFSGLPAGQDLHLIVTDVRGRKLDQRIFRTCDIGDRFKFAICSCMDDAHHDSAIWNDLSGHRPDMIFFIGDAVYADKEVHSLAEARPVTLWRRFAESMQVLEIYHQRRLTPILAVWDDHDFGNNDTNSHEYPFTAESKKNFLAYFPQDPAYCRFLKSGPGISNRFVIDDHQIILMDDRTFRFPSRQGGRWGHWGQAQERWALQQISRHRGTTWLMNGSQFFPSVVWKESVSRNHPEQLAGFVAELRKLRRPVLFASGDVHYSEISRLEPDLLGFESFEVTSSSIHSTSFPGFPGIVPNRRRILSTGERNYVLVTGQTSVDGPVYHVQSRSAGGLIRFEKRIAV